MHLARQKLLSGISRRLAEVVKTQRPNKRRRHADDSAAPPVASLNELRGALALPRPTDLSSAKSGAATVTGTVAIAMAPDLSYQ